MAIVNPNLQFEIAMTMSSPSLAQMFKAFEKDAEGNYIRTEVQEMWRGWKLHARWIADGHQESSGHE
jgi:hypothetical protein